MQETLEDQRTTMPRGVRRTRDLTLLSATFLVVQVSLTNYGTGYQGAAVTWLLIGLVLLWFVYRKRSRVARGLVIVTSWVGAVVFALTALSWPVDWRAVLLVLAYAGQAVPLMLLPVRRHVGSVPAES